MSFAEALGAAEVRRLRQTTLAAFYATSWGRHPARAPPRLANLARGRHEFCMEKSLSALIRRVLTQPGRRSATPPAWPSPHPATATEPVSVVIPAHDEAGTIAEVVRRCQASTPDLLEVLVVDDGSRDDTAALAEAAGARVLRLSPNQGKGVALRRGFDEARGERLVCLDADGQDHPEEIPLLLDALAPGVGLVIGSRFIGRLEPGAISPLNRLGSYGLRAVLNGLWGLRVTDPFAGFRAFRRSALEGCTFEARHYDIEVDMLLGLVQRGVRVVEVPVRRSRREHGQTDLGSFRDGARMLRRMVTRRVASLVGR